MSRWRDDRGQALVLSVLVMALVLVVLMLGAFRVAGGYSGRALVQDAADAAALAAAKTAVPVVRLHVQRERVWWTEECVAWASESKTCTRTEWREHRTQLGDAVLVGATVDLLAQDGRLNHDAMWRAGCADWGTAPQGRDETVCTGWRRDSALWWYYPDPNRARDAAEAWLAANGFAPGERTVVREFRVQECDPAAPDDPSAPCTGSNWLTVQHTPENTPLSAPVTVRAAGSPKRLKAGLPMQFP